MGLNFGCFSQTNTNIKNSMPYLTLDLIYLLSVYREALIMTQKSKRSKYLFILGLIALVLISFLIGYIIYINQAKSERAEKVQEIQSVSRLKMQQATEWYKDELHDAEVISGSESFSKSIRNYINNPEGPDTANIRNLLQGLVSEHGYEDVFLKSGNNILFPAQRKSMKYRGTIVYPITFGRLKSSGFFLTDSGRVHIDLISYLFNNGTDTIDIVFRIDPSMTLFPMLFYTPAQVEYETFLMASLGDSVVLIEKSNYDNSSSIVPGKKVVLNDLVKPNKRSSSNILNGRDYRNREVLAFYDQIPDTPWIFMSDVARSDIYRHFNRQALLTLLLVAMIIITVATFVSLRFSLKQRNIYRSLWKSQQEFKTTLYSIGDAVIITDTAGLITLMNKKAQELTGWKESEAINKELFKVFPVKQSILLSRQGLEVPISHTATDIRDEAGNTIGVVIIFRDQTEEKKREAALIESEEKYYRMFADSPQPMWIYDLDTLAILEVNESATVHYGYSREEFLQMTIRDIRPEEDIELLLTDISNTFNSYNDAGIWRHRKKNGDLIYVNIKSHLVTFNKRPARHVLAHDITQIQLAAEALQESEQKFRNLFEEHSAVKLLIDPETGTIADANQAAVNFYGYPSEQLIGMHLSNINTSNPDKLKGDISSALDQRKIHFEFTHRCSDGTLREVEVFSSKIVIKGKPYLHSIIHDVTEQKKARLQIRLLIQSIEQSPVGILITNPEGFVEFANSRMTIITGYEKEQIVGSISKILISGNGNTVLQKRIWSIIRSGDMWKGEFEDRKKDGSVYWAKAAISPIFDDEGIIRHYILVYEDISEQKKMLSELITAKIKAEESDHLKTAFLANMSHEIRTPMNGILGFMDLLQQPGLTGDQIDEYVSIVKLSGERLLSTINDIIDISKIEAGQSILNNAPVDINELLQEQYNFFKREADKKALNFSVVLLPPESRTISTDAHKLSSVLINLIKNALKFTRKGSITFGAYLHKNEIEFVVRDTGKGIPAGRLNSIFDRFVQADVSISRDYEGTGLGLSIAKAYVEMMGGSITVDSKVGEGTTFTFKVPRTITTNKEPASPGIFPDLTASLHDKTILIAEDDEISYIYINRLLAPYKIKLLRAYNGREAVDLFKTSSSISLVLMDIKMPVMDGYQAVREIRETDTGTPVIALTAFAFSDDREKALAAGCNDYLSKPVKKEQLIDMLRKYSITNATA